MNSTNAKDYLPLVQALAEGKVIQGKMLNDVWVNCIEPSFLSDASLYRIRPEPREIWVNRYPDGTESGAYPAKYCAVRGGHSSAIQVCYREVIE